jgi:high-affinity iron transporter
VLATLVIGLREGLEAALIVSIVAAFLKKNGRSDALKLVWIGVGTAVAICLAVGILLQRLEASLPQRQQEMLECIVAVAAVLMVSYMILWMKSHSRGLKGSLEVSAGGALASGSAMALVVMAFLAVFREGFETAVFLLAAFSSSVSPVTAVLGAVLGVAIAVLLGVLLYRGAVKLDMSRFFRATGVVLVFVAAGLVMSALRAAYEAGWVTVGQQHAANLSWLAEPGTIQSSLLTGVLGIRADPTVIEITAWLLYLVPMLIVVLWPPRRPLSRVAAGRLLTGAGVAALAVAALLALTAPPAATAVTGPQTLAVSAATISSTAGAGSGSGTSTQRDGTVTVTLSSGSAESTAAASGADPSPAAPSSAAPTSAAPSSVGASSATISATIGPSSQTVSTALSVTGHADVDGQPAVVYQGASVSVPVDAAAAGLPSTVTGTELLDGGRLPIGLQASDSAAEMPARYTDTIRTSLSVDPATGIVLDIELRAVRTVAVTTVRGTTVSGGTISATTVTATDNAVDAQAAAARSASADAIAHGTRGHALPAMFLLFALVMFAFGVPKLFRRRRSAAPVGPPAPPTRTPDRAASPDLETEPTPVASASRR